MSDRFDALEWAHPEALARLDEFFRNGAGDARSSFSRAFMGKYEHWFGPSAPALSR